jgi:hypothetical protein
VPWRHRGCTTLHQENSIDPQSSSRQTRLPGSKLHIIHVQQQVTARQHKENRMRGAHRNECA